VSNPFVPIQTANIVWRDNLPFSFDFNDIYFSTENGLEEAKHVFIEGNNLVERWQNLSQEYFIIAETGFGSGLNFLLTWALWLQYAPGHARLHFLSCEKFPFCKADLSRCLNLWPQLYPQAQALLAHYPVLTPGFHHLIFEEGRVNLTLMLGDALSNYNQLLTCGDPSLERALQKPSIDAWFLDGFSPAKNADMWSEDLFYLIALLSRPGTTVATFSTAKVVKSNLQNLGFHILKMKGFGQKREMLTALCEDPIPLKKRKFYNTPWHYQTPIAIKNKHAIVVGAGLAGCYTANALARRNWKVTLIDSKQAVGQGASGNKQAVLYPKLSFYQSPLTIFMLSAFLFAVKRYQTLLKDPLFGELTGIMQLAFSEKEKAAQRAMKEWLLAYPDLGVLVDSHQSSQLAGVQLTANGLFIPLAGWLNCQKLCETLVQHEGIKWVPNTPIQDLILCDKQWLIDNYSAEIVIIANGYQAGAFSQTNFLPLKPIRGQVTIVESNEQSQKLKIPLCGDGHILPAYENGHSIGATYHLGSTAASCSNEDDAVNLRRLRQIASKLAWQGEWKNSWAGVRGATTDYLPAVGLVPDAEQFNQFFAPLQTNAKRWLPPGAVFYPGLYLCAGFGSRGLTTVPLAAEWLASLINNEPSFLPRNLIQALSPARFLRRSIIKKT
jgi:tRNA 5-methylaminomethyl-2-thiouridine biosynthesis bifunctional protein